MKRSGRLFGYLLFLAAFLLTACPQPPPEPSDGKFFLRVDATQISRCPGGIKVEVSLDTPALASVGGNRPENRFIYGAGEDWIWVKPGYNGMLEWIDDASDNLIPQGTVTITASCMSEDGAVLGVSKNRFLLDDYLTCGGIDYTGIICQFVFVFDSGEDPSYTVQNPGLTICDSNTMDVDACKAYEANR